MNARVWAVLLITTGLMAVGAQATDFTGAESTDWWDANNWTAGVPDANTPANIGTTAYPNVSVVITGTANAGRTIVGASGGASVTGSITISANSTLNTWGSFYNSDEEEDHGFDIGGAAAGNLTLEANAQLNMMVGDAMGVGKDDRWLGGFETHVIMKPGSAITVGSAGDGWANFGLGDGNYHQTFEMHNATINGGRLFHIGGTVIIKGSNYASHSSNAYSDPKGTFMKLVGDNPFLYTPPAVHLHDLALDVSECNYPAPGQWFTVLESDPGTYWPSGSKNVYFRAGTPPEWEVRCVHPMPSGSEKKVQIRYNLLVGDMDLSGVINTDDVDPFVLAMTEPNAYIATYGRDPNLWGDCDGSGKLDADDITPFVALVTGGQAIPEPVTLALLALGGLGALIRKRR